MLQYRTYDAIYQLNSQFMGQQTYMMYAVTIHVDEANLPFPDFRSVYFFDGHVSGHALLQAGMAVAALGLLFSLILFLRLRRLPTYSAIASVSELIYRTSKRYLKTQLEFLYLLEAIVAALIVFYFGFLLRLSAVEVTAILACNILGIAASLLVAAFAIRVNTLASARTVMASLTGSALPCSEIPLRSGVSIGIALISIELVLLLGIVLFIPRAYAGSCLIGFAIGESLGAAALRIAGGIFTKIADIGADLMKVFFNLKEDDASNPGVIADCTGDNAGDSLGPSADGFETYGVTGVALIVVILSSAYRPALQAQLLVWLFVTQVALLLSALGVYVVHSRLLRIAWTSAQAFDFEQPLTSLIWWTCGCSIAAEFGCSYLLLPQLAGDGTLWWKLGTIVACGTLAAALIPNLVKAFTSPSSRHVRELVRCSEEGGASLNILSGLVAGNLSCYWLGVTIVGLMALAYSVSTAGLGTVMSAPSVFAFGLVAYGLLGLGPTTIAVDSYGPVADNAQSVFELSMIEQSPVAQSELAAQLGAAPDFPASKLLLEQSDGAGNTFKATAKPVLIGTAAVGATAMTFSVVLAATGGLQPELLPRISILHPPFLLGLMFGGAVIYWFSGASIQAVTTGAFRAVRFIREKIRPEAGKASDSDSEEVVKICTRVAQRGTLNIFLGTFFATLSIAFLDQFMFIGYLISVALFGLYQAIFMANAGGAWDNAKKLIETERRASGTPLHVASVIGDTVGDPFKDTASVGMNPIIKFTSLIGLLAVQLSITLSAAQGPFWGHVLGIVFLITSAAFVWLSFYGMRIEEDLLQSEIGSPAVDSEPLLPVKSSSAQSSLQETAPE